MNRMRGAEQNRSDGHARSTDHLDQVIGDIGRIQIWHDQHVSLPLERRIGISIQTDLFGQRRIAMHLAINIHLTGGKGRQ